MGLKIFSGGNHFPPHPIPPTLTAYVTPPEGGTSNFLFVKMTEKNIV